MQGFPIQTQLQEMLYDPKTVLDEQNWYNQRHGTPDELTSRVVYMLGDYGKNYPISMMTFSDIMGKSSQRSVELADVQYEYPIMGRDTKASVISSDCTSAGSVNTANAGIGFGKFKLRFADNWLKRRYLITSGLGTQAVIEGDPVQIGTGEYEYTCQLAQGSEVSFCPDIDLTAGSAWIALFAPVPESQSRSTESTMVAPGKVKNQMTHIRKGMSWAGNSGNKIMKMTIKTDKGETSRWMDLFMYQFEKNWLNECEHLYWYSRYNRQSNGTIELKDAMTGKGIATGAGLLEQIGNYSTYTRLSFDGMQKKIGNALFGQSDTANMSITLHTGTGGFRELQRMLKEAGIQLLGSLGGGSAPADLFINGSSLGYDLKFGGYFDGFYHVDGYTIKIKKNPIFDMGQIAMAQVAGKVVHPESGLPLESYRMVFIDDSTYDGQPNLQHVTLKGRSYQEGIVTGMTPTPIGLAKLTGVSNSSGIQVLSSDVDESSYHRLKVGGVQLLRSNKCFHMENVAGL